MLCVLLYFFFSQQVVPHLFTPQKKVQPVGPIGRQNLEYFDKETEAQIKIGVVMRWFFDEQTGFKNLSQTRIF